MALSTPLSPIPEEEPDKFMRVLIPMQVDGVRFSYTHGELILQGVGELEHLAAQEGVTLRGRPAFKVVTMQATGDVFLMGEQEWFGGR